MKIKVLMLFLLFLCACSNENDVLCPNSSLKETLVGVWTVQSLGKTLGEVEFKKDGFLVDNNEILVGGSVYDVLLPQKIYWSDSDVKVNFKASNGYISLQTDRQVIKFSCEAIEMRLADIKYDFLRKNN